VPKPIPLIDYHKRLGASIGEFSGFLTPIVYDSIIKEHLSVRNEVGIFDISHMAMIYLKGSCSTDLLEKTIARKVASKPEGVMIGPSLILNEKGGIKDDVMVYKISDEEWLVIGNAANTEKDIKWLENVKQKIGCHTSIEYINDNYSLLALQGPRASKLMEEYSRKAVELKPLQFITNEKIGEYDAWIVSRSGWTGEDGFEIIAEHKNAMKIFDLLLKRGAKPCGLGARDSLRLEMGFLLYGSDMDEETSPIEARYWLGFDYDKTGYIGYEALRKKLLEGATKTRVALRLSKKDRSVPRHGMKIYIEEKEVGWVTSGGYSPLLGRPIGMGYIVTTHALMGLKASIDIRGNKHTAKITDFPLIKK
jgi:aminomethyltransferase